MISPELKDKVCQVIKASITIEEFEEWLVPRLPAFLTPPDSADSNVVAAIELGLAEMSAGIMTRDAFLKFLKSAVQEQETILLFYPPSDSPEAIVSSSSNRTSHPTLDFTATVTAQL